MLEIHAVELNQADAIWFQVHVKTARGFKLEVHPTKLLKEEVITVQVHVTGAKMLRFDICSMAPLQTDPKRSATQWKGAVRSKLVNQAVKPLHADDSKFKAEENGAR